LSKPDSETKVIGTIVLLAYLVAMGVLLGKALADRERKDADLRGRVSVLERKTKDVEDPWDKLPNFLPPPSGPHVWTPDGWQKIQATTETENGDTP
jgi:hypothetical protein